MMKRSGLIGQGRRVDGVGVIFDGGDSHRLAALKLVVVLGLAWGLISTWSLWQPRRLCPKTPIWDRLESVPFEDAACPTLLLILLGILLLPQPVLPVLAWVGLVSLLCLGDWTRMRPWIYQHTLMLLTMAATYWGALSLPEGLNACRLILVCVYFWAGILKANRVFFTIVYPWIVGPFLGRLPAKARTPMRLLGYGAPWIEACLAVGLLFPALRGLALSGAVLMHVLILLCFSPLGHRNYGCIWPWNLSMLMSAQVLFWGTNDVGASEILVGSSGFHQVVGILVGVVPALGLGNLLDPVFCHGHMCGRHVFALVGLSRRVHSKLPEAVQRFCVRSGWGKGPVFVLDLGPWYLAELKVPPPQQEGLLRRVARDFQRYGAGEEDLNLTVFRMPGFLSRSYPVKVYGGRELLSEFPGSVVPC